MSLVELRIELPSYSHSFSVSVPPSSTIRDVKHAIAAACTGSPSPEGQRLIWRGRCVKDEERVSDIWKTRDEPRIVHLAVHPSAWATAPPEIPPTPIERPSINPLPTTPMRVYTNVPVSSIHAPIYRPMEVDTPPRPRSPSFLQFTHDNALLALTEGITSLDPPDFARLRNSALSSLARNGWAWPPIFDEPYPAPIPGEQTAGVRYEKITLEGKDYLQLLNPTGTPTPMQLHALKVLTYTFWFLAYLPQPTTPSHLAPVSHGQQHHVQLPIPAPRDVNGLLQQLGLGHLRVADPNVPQQQAPAPAVGNFNPHQNQRVNVHLALRPLMAPMLMLAVRTLLLLYFVSPTRKPVFGIMISAWILYEAWRAIRVAFGVIGGGPGERGAAGAPRREQNANAAEVPRAPDAEPHRQPAPQPRAGAERGAGANEAHSPNMDAVLEMLGNINLQAEEAALAAPTPRPGILHKLSTFATLLLLTLHPAVWNRRRTALRQREGRIRTEAGAREGSDEEERQARVRAELMAQHERRPGWVREYVERARRGEWVDDI